MFNARIMSLGNEFKMHHLHAIKFEVTGQSIQLSDIIVRESTLPWTVIIIIIINKHYIMEVKLDDQRVTHLDELEFKVILII